MTIRSSAIALTVSSLLALPAVALSATTAYVYTNDNASANTITTFALDRSGVLTNLGAVSTGGAGCTGGLYAANRVAGGKTSISGDYLMAQNCASSALSVFTGAKSGKLTLKMQLSGEGGDASIVGTPKCFVVGYASSGNVVSYSVPGFALASSLNVGGGALDGMAYKIVQGTHYVAAAVTGISAVSVMTLNQSNCTLTLSAPIPTYAGGATGVAFSPSGAFIYASHANFDSTIVEAFSFPGGIPQAGSPYIYSSGSNSNTLVATANCLFVANQYSAAISAVPLSAGVPAPGAVPVAYPIGASGTPSGIALAPTGSLVVAIGGQNAVSAQMISSGCVLTQGGGGAVPTGDVSGFLESLTVVPVDKGAGG